MKLIAHRGWSTGPIENTMAAFQKAHEAGIDGVEFDVRFAIGSNQIVVSHNRKRASEALLLDEALAFLASTDLELFIEIKQRNPDLSRLVGQKLHEHGITDRAYIFAHKHRAKYFNWADRRHKLGMIAFNPLLIGEHIDYYQPDVIMLCFSLNRWTWELFWWYWTPEKLEALAEEYPKVDFIWGVDDHHNDAVKVCEIPQLHGLTTNRPEVWIGSQS